MTFIMQQALPKGLIHNVESYAWKLHSVLHPGGREIIVELPVPKLMWSHVDIDSWVAITDACGNYVLPNWDQHLY